MSDGWESTGGAGGISANYDDMESLSVLYGRAALTLAEAAAEVAFIAASGELMESAVLSPGSYAQVMRVIGELELGRTGLAASGLELGELSLHLTQAVLAYRFVDAAMSRLTIGAQNLGGFVVGAALPAVVVPAAGLVLGGEAARDLPGFLDDLVDGRASLSSFPSRVLFTTKQDANTFVLGHPGLVQDGIGGAAGLETGLQAWVPAPVRWALPFQGVPRDYPQAMQNLAGFFRDGDPHVGDGGDPQPGDDTAPSSVRDLFNGVDRRQRRSPETAAPGEIGVQRLVGPDGTVRFVVQLPGTESWALTPGSTARDLSTNLHTMAGGSTVYMRGIEAAMAQAGVPPGAQVMLVGHSQGGMTAAALAADPAFRQRFNVTQVVTAGAPIARFEVPAGVQVLAVENRNDLVPALDGADNPDRANVTTVTFGADKGTMGENHSLRDTYAAAAADLPAGDPSYAAWRESARGFLDPDNQARPSTRHHPRARPVRRPSVLAVICVVLAAVSTGLLAGCDGGPTPGSEAAVARQKANDTVIRQLEALPGAKVNATIESSMDGGQNNIEARAVLPATATTAQLNAMADTIERTIWLSHVDPLGRIGLIVRRQGGTEPVLQRLYQDEIDTRPLGVKYGPRPDGLPG